MAKRRVAEIVAERDRFGQLLVQVQHLRYRARDLRYFQRVRQPRAVVIAGRRNKHLRLVLEPSEGLGVDDPIAIALERRTNRVLGLLVDAALAVSALRGLRRQDLALSLLELFTDRYGHAHSIMSRRKLVPCASLP